MEIESAKETSKCLNKLLEKYHYIRLASESDNQALLELFNDVSMETDTNNICIKRGSNFFKLLNEQNPQNIVFVFLNKDQTIGGAATLGVRNCYVNKKLTRCVYSGDLRTKTNLNKRARVEWRKCYYDIVKNFKHLKQFLNAEYFYTAILANNQAAIRAFENEKSPIEYRKLSEYSFLSIIHKLPRIDFSKSRYKIRGATNKDKCLIKNFLSQNKASKNFGDYISDDRHDEFERRLKTWTNFNISDFYLCFNSQKELIGCFAPWSNSESKQVVLNKMNFEQRILNLILKLKRKKGIAEGESINFLHLTHFEVAQHKNFKDQHQIAKTMINYAYKHLFTKEHHVLSLLDINLDLKKDLQKSGLILDEVKGNLYQVIDKESDNGTLLKSPYYEFENAIY